MGLSSERNETAVEHDQCSQDEPATEISDCRRGYKSESSYATTDEYPAQANPVMAETLEPGRNARGKNLREANETEYETRDDPTSIDRVCREYQDTEGEYCNYDRTHTSP